MSVAHLAMEHVSDPVTEQTGLRELADGTLMGVLSAIRKCALSSALFRRVKVPLALK